MTEKKDFSLFICKCISKADEILRSEQNSSLSEVACASEDVLTICYKLLENGWSTFKLVASMLMMPSLPVFIVASLAIGPLMPILAILVPLVGPNQKVLSLIYTNRKFFLAIYAIGIDAFEEKEVHIEELEENDEFIEKYAKKLINGLSNN